jgi:diaminopimelate epimerase
MGNPHFVTFAEDWGRPIDDELVLGLGPRLETHPAFPKKTNVGFVEVVSEDEIRLRVWERGVGETLACGTGACAAAVASAALSRTKRDVLVRLPGGDLRVRWAEDGHVWMAGPAEEVFSGHVDTEWLSARGLA